MIAQKGLKNIMKSWGVGLKWEMSPLGLDIWTLVPQKVALFGDDTERSGGGALLELSLRVGFGGL